MLKRSPSSRVQQLEDVIAKTEAQIAEKDEQARQHGVAADEADAEKIAIASAEAGGSIDSAAARERYEEADAKARRHRLEIERLGQVRALHERDLEGFRAEVEQARYGAAVDAWSDECEKANQRSRALASLLRKAVKEARSLAEARAAVDDARSQARELRPANVDDQEPATRDEPSWPNVAELVAILEAGPRQPSATAAETAAEYERQRRQGEASRIEQAARGGSREIDRLPEHLHDAAHKRRTELLEEAKRSRIAAAEAEAEEQGRPLRSSELERLSR